MAMEKNKVKFGLNKVHYAKITPSKQISEKDKLYQTIIKDHKHTQKESDSIPGKIGDKIRAMDVSSSKYAYQWKDSKGIRKQSVLVVDKDGLKLYTLSGKRSKSRNETTWRTSSGAWACSGNI